MKLPRWEPGLLEDEWLLVFPGGLYWSDSSERKG